jgi:hypothetical protein
MRKNGVAERVVYSNLLHMDNGIPKGVVIGYPEPLHQRIKASTDLLPDIQSGEISEITNCFNEKEWALATDEIETEKSTIRTISPKYSTCEIRIGTKSITGMILVLIRLNAGFCGTPFKISLMASTREIASVSVFQSEAFLLKGELYSTGCSEKITLCLSDFDNSPLVETQPVSILGIRACYLPPS